MSVSYSVSSTVLDAPHGVGTDERRHQAKVEEAIRRHLADMVTDEKILVTSGRRTVAVPLAELKEFRIRFDASARESIGSRRLTGGEDEEGQEAGAGQDGRSKEGGDAPGQDIEETAVTLEEVHRAVFSELELPDLDPTKRLRGVGREYVPHGVASTGIWSQWDRKRTLRQSLLRQAQGDRRPGLVPEDLRFRVMEPTEADQGGAVVIAMMDTSGSMGSFEKYLAKSFFYWTTEFLRQKYPYVDLVFLAHDVRAREVDEESFFHRGASGGTVSSSVYRLALQVVQDRYPADEYNVYAFHFTDGGNLTSDNGLALETGHQLAGRVTLFGYGEIHDTERNPSPLYQEFSEVAGLGVVILREKEDIFRAMTHFFGRREEHSHAYV
jgi:sporulation protein YhbH